MNNRYKNLLCAPFLVLLLISSLSGCKLAPDTITTPSTAPITTLSPAITSTVPIPIPKYTITAPESSLGTQTPNDEMYAIKLADEAFLSQIDRQADGMRKAILSSPSEYETSGITYYVSNHGNDTASGLSPRAAWATIAKVNDFSLSEGSNVLFERGGLWREQIQAKNGVTYSAYGDGEKPKIYGSKRNYSVITEWLQTEYPNIYVNTSTFNNDVGIIIFNNGDKVGVKKIKYVSDFTGIENLSEDLNFYHNPDDKKLYLYSFNTNPAQRFSSIEIGDKRHGIVLTGQKNVTIDNLCLKYWGAHGVSAGGVTTQNLTVRNCEFGWIGGSILNDITRFGNAVEIWGGCDGYKVENCYIYQIYDTGITHQFKSTDNSLPDIKIRNVLYKDNLIEYCTYSIEYFLTQNDHPGQLMENILITGNLCRFSGYGWGDQRPQKNTAAHINGWDANNYSANFTIENNIFDLGKYKLIHIGAASANYLPIMRNNIYINQLDLSLGEYGQRPSLSYIYDINVGRTIKDILKDVEAKIYYLANKPR